MDSECLNRDSTFTVSLIDEDSDSRIAYDGSAARGLEGDAMDRRNFLAGGASVALRARFRAQRGPGALALKSAGGGAVVGATTGRPPNVLLLMADQHRRSCMGICGDPVVKTPNLDRLASGAVRFTNAYCNNPVCTPSRASMMTGLYSHHIEAQDNVTPFAPTHPTIAHHFNRAGYLTGLVGKMHFVDAQTHGFEFRLGFNDWLQYLGPKAQTYVDEVGRPNSGAGLPEIEDLWREEGDPWKGHRVPDIRKGPVAVGDVSRLEEQDHFDSFVSRESVRFLRRFGHSSQPFFLVSSFLKPHDPFTPARRFAEMFKAEEMYLPSNWGKADKSRLPREVVRSIEFNAPTPEMSDPVQARKRIALYYACLAQMDDCLGKVLQAVMDLQLEDDTIIGYTSDHGEMLGELGLWQKFEFYEGSCAVPLMFKVPGRSAGICTTPVSLVSMSSTLTGLAGVKQLAPNDGIGLMPWIEDPQNQKDYGPIFAEYGLHSKQPKSMIRLGQWKYTYWLHDIPELYNLDSDPEELRNLEGDPKYAAKEEQLRTKLLEWHRMT